jgi:hypothetical protein
MRCARLVLGDVLDDQLVIDCGDLPRNDRGAGVEVEVAPSKTETLTAPAARGGKEDPCREQAAVGRIVEEHSELVGRPRLGPGRTSRCGGRGSSGVGDVPNHSVPAQGVLECRMDDCVDVPNRARRQTDVPSITDCLRWSASDQRGNRALRQLALGGQLRADCLGDLLVARFVSPKLNGSLVHRRRAPSPRRRRSSSCFQQTPVHPVEVDRRESLERDVPDVREHVEPYISLVRVPRALLQHGRPTRREPLVDEERGHADLLVLDIGPVGEGAQCGDARLFRGTLRLEAALAVLPPATVHVRHEDVVRVRRAAALDVGLAVASAAARR